MCSKSKLYKKFILLPTISNESKLKKYRNKLKCLLKAAEESCYAELFANCGNDLIKTWKVIKGILHGYTTATLPSTFTKMGHL